MPDSKRNPCVGCGACCAHFRASFYWAETDMATPEGVPAALTEHLTGVLSVMKGTNRVPPRCVALEGEIGSTARCSIHPVRSSVCREFPPSFEDGSANPRCDRARAAHGLLPIVLQDWASRP